MKTRHIRIGIILAFVALLWSFNGLAHADTNNLRYNATPQVTTDNGLVEGHATETGAQLVYPYAAPVSSWSFASATAGILNTTTAVTMKTAAAAGLRNYVTSCQLMSEALGAATELAIRDGAAGTVIWRTKIGASGIADGSEITFPTPLRGTAATLLEVVTLTASVTGAVYVNCQGFVAP